MKTIIIICFVPVDILEGELNHDFVKPFIVDMLLMRITGTVPFDFLCL